MISEITLIRCYKWNTGGNSYRFLYFWLSVQVCFEKILPKYPIFLCCITHYLPLLLPPFKGAYSHFFHTFSTLHWGPLSKKYDPNLEQNIPSDFNLLISKVYIILPHRRLWNIWVLIKKKKKKKEEEKKKTLQWFIVCYAQAQPLNVDPQAPASYSCWWPLWPNIKP